MSYQNGNLIASVPIRKQMSAAIKPMGLMNGRINRVATKCEKDYENLDNLPQKDGVIIIGNQTNEELHIAAVKTCDEWAQLTELVSVRGEAYVYSDAGEDEDGNPIPKIKYGDGNAYVVDLPFTTAIDFRITQTDIDNWNGKVSVRIEGDRLIFY